MDTSKFTENAVGVAIAVIIVGSVTLPIVSGITIADTVANQSAMTTILGIIPLFMLIGVLIGAIALFIKSKQ